MDDSGLFSVGVKSNQVQEQTIPACNFEAENKMTDVGFLVLVWLVHFCLETHSETLLPA